MRKLVGLLSGVALSLAISAPAFAAQPASHACLGGSVSTAARALRPLGQVVVAPTARGAGGVGENRSAHHGRRVLGRGFPQHL